MYQYDDPTAAVTLPTPAAAGTAGYFTDGNAAGGEAATILRADFMNMLMQELLNILAAGSVSPSKTTYNQVLTAIEAIHLASFTGSNQSLALPGYQKLPGGLILQWGQQTVPATTLQTISFPISFPTATLGGSATNGVNNTSAINGPNLNLFVSPSSASQFQIGNPNGASQNFAWTALGH